MSTLCLESACWVSRCAFVTALARKGFSIFGLVAAAAILLTPAASPAAASSPPRVVITAASPEIFIDGDCNNPAVWLDGELRIFGSPYPQNGTMGGVASYRYGSSVLQLGGTRPVNPDRSVLGGYNPPAFGPWFESVLVDDDGALWAYYHAEFPDAEHNKVHPRIGAQVSRDHGQTWQDLGVLIDTPSGTDEYHSWLGCGFSGGNGDFSVMLDPEKNYLYFFYSQYGYTDAAQGLAVARMRWSDRAAPVGQVKKWYQGAWQGVGLGGPATPFLPNVGDVHGLRRPFDFWWGPSIHWNTYLQRYVIMLSRSNVGDFVNRGGIDNWYMTSTSLEDPTHWDEPSAMPFPNGYQGSWYPQVIGLGVGETDKLAGRDARLLVQGHSIWQIRFLKPGEGETPVNAAPVVSTTIPDQTATAGIHFSYTPVSETFFDKEGEALDWKAGTLPLWLSFDPTTHVIAGTPTADAAGQIWAVDLIATDPHGLSATATFFLTVMAPPLPPLPNPNSPRKALQITVGNGLSDLEIAPGTTLSITGRAIDRDGHLDGHWLEICNPAGVWSWEGWLTEDPWGFALVGTSFSSVKTAPFTFDQPGFYRVRTTTVDTEGNWMISSEVHVRVGPNSLPLVQIEVAGEANQLEVNRGTTLAIASRATDREGDILEHWLELRNPDGAWSWEGWLTSTPWDGVLGGSGFSSAKSSTYTFDQPGYYVVRGSTLDQSGEWTISTELTIHVVDTLGF